MHRAAKSYCKPFINMRDRKGGSGCIFGDISEQLHFVCLRKRSDSHSGSGAVSRADMWLLLWLLVETVLSRSCQGRYIKLKKGHIPRGH